MLPVNTAVADSHHDIGSIPACSNACVPFSFFSSRRRHTRLTCDWSSDVCSSDLLKSMLAVYSSRSGGLRLIARGLSPAVSSPVVVDDRDQSTPQSRSGSIFSVLPYFFVLTVFMGGMYLSIDLTAGERERHSLEPLFVNPVARWRILLGKIGAICAFSVTSLLICVTAFIVAGHLIPTEKLGMALSLGPAFAFKVLVLMLPLVVLLAALQTLV